MKVLIDTNVIVDVLQQREPFYEMGEQIFIALASKIFVGCVTAKQIADIHFFTRKQFIGEKNKDIKARLIIAKLLLFFEVINTTKIDCQNAIFIENGDYEDALLITSAVSSDVDAIVTRDNEHFKNSDITIYSPDDFIKQIL